MPTINGRACVVNGNPVDKVYSNWKIVYGRNLLTSANGEIGNINGENGEPIGYSFTNYYRTKDFIEVLPSTHYFLKVNSPSDTFSTIEKVIWYDSDKTYISSTGYSDTITCAITSPKNAAFFKLTVWFEDSIPAGTNIWRDNKVKFEEGTIPTAWTPAPVDKVFSNGKQVYGRNLWIRSKAVSGRFDGNDNIGTPDAENLISDFISVDANQTYIYHTDVVPTITGKPQTWDSYIFFDSNKAQLGDRNTQMGPAVTMGTSQHTEWIIKPPVDASFIRTGSRYLQHGTAKLEKGSVATPWTPAPEDVM